jgi:DNA-binding LytR/AlgR family response regulator
MRMTDGVELKGCRFLVVEDEYIIAADLAASLEAAGIEVAGPAGSVEEALTLLENNGDRLDGAVLDINLGRERVYPVAELLRARGIPFVFTTGYDDISVSNLYADVPRCQKPIDEQRLMRCLAEVRQQHRAASAKHSTTGDKSVSRTS